MNGIPCAIVRGGTSKGVFLLEEHLPADPGERDRLLLALMGSPDPRQIDGLGGADPLTSKVAIVSRSTREGIDVEYESLEVGISEAQVNHGLMCGNLIAGVGHFAIAEGLIPAQSPLTTIRIFCRSNHKVIAARIPHAAIPGDAVMGRSETPPVNLRFERPGGALTGQLLPAGEPVSLLSLAAGRLLAVSLVDAGTLYAFVLASALGLSGDESVAALDADAGLRANIEALREQAAERINRRHASRLAAIAPRLVKVAIVGPAPPERRDIDLVARIINRAKTHKAYAVSGGICLAAAAVVPDSVVNTLFAPRQSPFALRIGHPSGVLTLTTRWSTNRDGVLIEAAEIARDARIIMRGTAYPPPAGAVVPLRAVASTRLEPLVL